MLSALLDGIVSHLKTVLPINDTRVGICPEPGRPPPSAPLEYFSVVDGGVIIKESPNLLRTEEYVVKVICSRRAANTAFDQLGFKLIKPDDAIAKMVRLARLHLWGNYTLQATVNTIITATFDGFVTPFTSCTETPIMITPPDWFGALEGSDGVGHAEGLFASLIFRGAIRYQHSSYDQN